MLRQLKRLWRINWYRTLQLNFRLLPFSQACRMPIVVNVPLYVEALNGHLELPKASGFATVEIGSRHETYKAEAGKAQFSLSGTMRVGGPVKIGVDTCLYIAQDAVLELGADSYIARDSQIHCFGHIILGEGLRAGEVYITDSASHQIVRGGEPQPMVGRVVVGDHVYLSSKVILLKGAVIPAGAVVGAGAVCTADYHRAPLCTEGKNVLIVGNPARVKAADCTYL